MKSLKLFNAVLSKPSSAKPFVSDKGYVIDSGALWAKKDIERFYKKEKLDGFGLNKSFHKSWRKISASSDLELLIEQIRHYISTYGSGFQDEIYIPREVLKVPDVQVVFKFVKSYTREELIDKCLELLSSGVALKEETINDLLTLLVDELSYEFTGEEGIQNKEAIVKIADMYGVIPRDTLAFFRYILYRATGESLLIKSPEVIEAIKQSNYNPAVQFKQFGLERLAEVFNRFKPLFLAFKKTCPKTINKISKLSKKHHKALVSNPLNYATRMSLKEEDRHWLDNATPFALFRALSACYARCQGQDTFTYRIRNGKGFVREKKSYGVVFANYEFLLAYCRERFDLSGKKFYLPKDIDYALPVSEKMFVGNVPAGTKFYGDRLAVGIYWENEWGAHDLDLSSVNIAGKVGWNARYKQSGDSLMCSGDITDAPQGAVEYLYANRNLSYPSLVLSNVFSGDTHCSYKLLVGRGDAIDYDYMMNPDNLFLEEKCQSIQRQMVLGLLMPDDARQCFMLMNYGAGASCVSYYGGSSEQATRALFQSFYSSISLEMLLQELGASFVDRVDEADFDLSLKKLQRDTFIQIFG